MTLSEMPVVPLCVHDGADVIHRIHYIFFHRFHTLQHFIPVRKFIDTIEWEWKPDP